MCAVWLLLIPMICKNKRAADIRCPTTDIISIQNLTSLRLNTFNLFLDTMWLLLLGRGAYTNPLHTIVFVHCPLQELYDFLCLGFVFHVFINQSHVNPEMDRIVSTGVLFIETRKSSGMFSRAPAAGCRNRFKICIHKFAGFVLENCIGEVVLHGITASSDVPDGTVRLFHQSGYAFISFSTEADRPIHRSFLFRYHSPCFTHFVQIIGEDVCCAASVRSMNNNDRLSGKFFPELILRFVHHSIS